MLKLFETWVGAGTEIEKKFELPNTAKQSNKIEQPNWCPTEL